MAEEAGRLFDLMSLSDRADLLQSDFTQPRPFYGFVGEGRLVTIGFHSTSAILRVCRREPTCYERMFPNLGHLRVCRTEPTRYDRMLPNLGHFTGLPDRVDLIESDVYQPRSFYGFAGYNRLVTIGFHPTSAILWGVGQSRLWGVGQSRLFTIGCCPTSAILRVCRTEPTCYDRILLKTPSAILRACSLETLTCWTRNFTPTAEIVWWIKHPYYIDKVVTTALNASTNN